MKLTLNLQFYRSIDMTSGTASSKFCAQIVSSTLARDLCHAQNITCSTTIMILHQHPVVSVCPLTPLHTPPPPLHRDIILTPTHIQLHVNNYYIHIYTIQCGFIV